MDIFQSIILGMVQGLGEFLPISSSGHLVFVPWLFGWEDKGLGFSVALHMGTLLSVLVYFKNDIWLLAKGFWHSLFIVSRDFENNIYQKLSWLIIAASIPGAVVGMLLEKQAEKGFRNPLLVALTLSVFGVVIFVVDRLGKKEKNLNKVTLKDSLLIGLSQALAIIPGVSRSGSTMATGLALGFKRADAARFSFLMSIPIIFGAGLVKVNEFKNGAATIEFWAGLLSSAVFGFLAIKFLLKYLSNNDFKVFTWYRLIVAAIVLLVYFIK